jgi:N-methylhydantoinase B
MPIEIMNWALRVETSVEPETARPSLTVHRRPAAVHRKSIYLGPEYGTHSTPVYERHRLSPGDEIDGPALIVEAQTSTLVEPRFNASVDSVGNLLLTRRQDPAPKRSVRIDDSVISRQLMWNRLLAVVEEQAQALIRGAFSPIVRECGDISAGIFDRSGRMLAQAVTGTPGHINTMASGVSNFIDAYPLPRMKPGDIYVTNDPWLAAGHLNDFMLVQPVFKEGEVVGFTSCTSHLVDVGGKCMGPEGTDVYDEGLRIPICRLVSDGEVNRPLLDIIAANSRHPTENEGDLYALIACCEVGASRLLSMMDEYALASLEALAEYILESSQRATTAAIRKLPNGKFQRAITVDGYELDIVLKAVLTIEDDRIALDFNGSSPCSKFGINVPLNYAAAYSVFAIRCAVSPGIPNNAGSLASFRVTAPIGCILNAVDPGRVAMRHTIGQLLPDLVFGCLHQALPQVVPAEGASCMYDLPMRNLPASAGTRFAIELVHNGGTGARPHKDGLSATAYPSGVWGSQVEVTECTAPLRVRRRELRPDSGGPGRYRGGLGQIIEIESSEDEDFLLFLSLDRVEHPARGRAGGSCGSTGLAALASGATFPGRGEAVVPRGDRLVFLTPGGGGHGYPLDRDPESVRDDVVRGLVSATAARETYGVVLDVGNDLDLAATLTLRGTKSC